VCLISDGRADQSNERRLDALPLGVPGLDIVNVGAGGGSLGWVDAGGMLQVGPQSAGADPGPACYGRGGGEPALTDALVALGWLRPEAFLGGTMTLDEAAAHAALAPLGEDAARAMIRIAVAHIARAVSQVSVQRGRDPRGYALYAFGGMGPVVAALVAEELRIARVVVPPHPGLFSALGLLLADLKRTYERTELVPLDGVVAGFQRLEEQAAAELAGYGYAPEQIHHDRTVAMRYAGQGFELLVPYTEDLEGAFHAAHRAAYGTAVEGAPVEAVTLRLEATIPRVDAPAPGALDPRGEPLEREVVFGPERRACTFAPRAAVSDLEGLAVIEEPTATTFVPPGWTARSAAGGALVLER
jgi:N-methylhydantoinase A